MKTVKYWLVIVSCVVMLLGTGLPGLAANLIQNGDFEQLSAEKIVFNWMEDTWNGRSNMGVTTKKVHSGKFAAIIDSKRENDARFIQTLNVEPDTVYRLTGWVATEGVSQSKHGACLTVMGGMNTSAEIRGDNEWQMQELIFKTRPGQTTVTVAARLGFYGNTTTGIAYFDDLAVEKLTDPQVQAQLLDEASLVFKSDNSKTVTVYVPKTLKTTVLKALGILNYTTGTVVMYLLLLGLLLVSRWGSRGGELGKTGQLETRLPLLFWGLACGAVLIRLPLMMTAPFETDLTNFKNLALQVAQTGPFAGGDGSPVCLLILWVVGKMAQLFRIAGNESLFNIWIKMPALICDLGTAWLLLTLGRKKNPVLGLVVAGVYLLLPTVLYNSAYWGQFDTYAVFMVVGALVLMVRQRRPVWAGVLLAAALLTNIQTLIFLPFFLLALFLKFERKQWFPACGALVGTLVLILLPFSFQQPLTWIVDFYRKQAEVSPNATFNAANFLALLGGNEMPDNTNVLPHITYAMIGYSLFLISAAWCINYYWRKRTWGGMVTGMAMMAYSLFMFCPRMHERFLFPVLALLLLVYLVYRDKRLLYINLLLSVSCLLNLHAVVLKENGLLNGELFLRALLVLSIFNTVLFIATWALFQLRLSQNKRQIQAELRQYGSLLQENCFGMLTAKPFALTARDYKMVGLIALIYCVLIFTRLGTTGTPSTGMDMEKLQPGVEVEFGQPVDIAAISWYDAEGLGQLQMEAYSDGSWKQATSLSCDNFYIQRRLKLDLFKVEHVRLVPQLASGHVKEVAFLDPQSRLIPIKSVRSMKDGIDVAPADHLLFDEQQKIADVPTYLNSTYFDEVYHGRTAYEFVKKTDVYETTHPHLGKDILALGILMFGMNPFGMRFMHAVIGIIFIIALFFLGRQVTAARFGAYATMLAGFFDFMPLVQSRYSTIDTTSVLFITLMLIFTFKYFREQLQPSGAKHSWGTIALVILFYAMGASVKWTAHYGFVGVVACVLLVKLLQYFKYRRLIKVQSVEVAATKAIPTKTVKKPANAKPVKAPKTAQPLTPGAFWRDNLGLTVLQWVLLFVLIAPVVYYLAYIPALHCQHIDRIFSPEALKAVLDSQESMYNYHSQLTATHPFSSTWWSWPFDFKPLWLYSSNAAEVPVGMKSTIVTMGNPLIWTLGWCAVLILLYQLLVKRKFSLLYLVFIAMFSFYLPWTLVTRATFIYHFFPVLPLYYVLGVCVLMPLWQMKKSGRQLLYTIAGLGVFLWLLYYPAITGMQVPAKYIDALRWFAKDWIF